MNDAVEAYTHQFGQALKGDQLQRSLVLEAANQVRNKCGPLLQKELAC
jgi:hypothetical protein